MFIAQKKSYEVEQEEKKFRQVIGSLLPYHILKVKLRSNKTLDFTNENKEAEKIAAASSSGRYMDNDNLPAEIISIKMSCLLYAIDLSREQQVEQISLLLSKKNELQQNQALRLL